MTILLSLSFIIRVKKNLEQLETLTVDNTSEHHNNMRRPKIDRKTEVRRNLGDSKTSAINKM